MSPTVSLCAGEAFGRCARARWYYDVPPDSTNARTLASSLRVDPCRGVLVAKAKRGNGIDSELYPVVFDPYKDSRSMGAGPKV